jgi:hypothetical protein
MWVAQVTDFEKVVKTIQTNPEWTGAYGFLIGSSPTTKRVAIGPRNSEANHQFTPLVPL